MHTIRLRRPWQRQIGDQAAQRVDVPDTDASEASRLSPQSSGQTVTYTRNFNRPTSVFPETKLWLRIESWEGTLARLAINDVELDVGDDRTLRSEIGGVLENANRISVTLQSGPGISDSPALPRLTGAVSLEIEDE